jgi:hypothetical protein
MATAYLQTVQRPPSAHVDLPAIVAGLASSGPVWLGRGPSVVRAVAVTMCELEPPMIIRSGTDLARPTCCRASDLAARLSARPSGGPAMTVGGGSWQIAE